MKKTLFFTAFAAILFAASCTKEPIVTPMAGHENTKEERELVSLSLKASTDATKVSGMVGEYDVNSLQVFVFDEDELEAVGYTSKGNGVTIKCYPGTKDVVAIANHREEIDWATISSANDLEEISSYLEDNSTGNYVMFGRQELVVGASDPVGTISPSAYSESVNVTRLVARVGIKKITNSTEGYYAGTLNIKSVYLINVAGNSILSSPYTDFTPTRWFNKSLYTGDCAELLYSGELNLAVDPGNSLDIEQYFYCYPNPTETDFNIESTDYDSGNGGSDWRARYTRIVVEAELKGKTEYYPVSIGGIQGNHTYTVTNMTVTGPGASNPDDGPRATDGDAVGNPVDWEDDVEYTPTF